MDSQLVRLTNPEFDFEWNGKTYRIKKANLKKVALYQERVEQYSKEEVGDSDVRLAAYALYLALSDQDSSLTEEYILDNATIDIVDIELMARLGFMNPAAMNRALANWSDQRTSVQPSSQSPTEPAGPQTI